MQCARVSGVRAQAHRGARRHVAPVSRRAIKVQALFGWGKKKEDEPDWKELERQDEYRKQQELLEKRRSGVLIKEANERRRQVQETLKSRKDLRRAEREALGRGEIPESFKDWKPYSDETNKNANSGIVVPLLPFGIRKYDEGERFDLRSPYADDGWVDPEETDMWGGFKKISQKILDFGQVKYTKPGEKPILWASEYEKQKNQAKKQQKDK